MTQELEHALALLKIEVDRAEHYLAGLTARDAHPTDQLGAYAEVVAARTREQTLGGSVES